MLSYAERRTQAVIVLKTWALLALVAAAFELVVTLIIGSPPPTSIGGGWVSSAARWFGVFGVAAIVTIYLMSYGLNRSGRFPGLIVGTIVTMLFYAVLASAR